MATNAGALIVDIQANIGKFKSNLEEAKKGLKGFANNTKSFIANHKLLIAGAVASVGAGIAKTIKAYGEEELAVAKLDQALRNQGKYSQQVSKDLQDFASSIQKVTTYGDEAVISLQAQLIAFGLEGDELKKSTKATLDLAAAKEIDLKSAADLVGKAFVGETGTLSRYGIILDKGIPKTQKFSNALEKMNAMFGGQAEAQRKTTLGQLTALGNTFGDLQETIGSLIAGQGNSLITVLDSWILNLDKSLKAIRDQTIAWGGFGETMKRVGLEMLREVMKMLINISNSMFTLGPIFKLLKIDIDAVKLSVDAQVDAWQAEINNSQRSAVVTQEGELKKQEAVKETTAVITEDEKKRNEEILRIADARIKRWQDDNAKKMELERDLAEKLKEQSEYWTTFAKDQANSMFDQFGQGVADMILEARKFSDVIKQIWKDIARAVIAEIAKMIAKWIAFQILTGGAGGGFASASSFFGGMASGGVIAEPSIITGMRSGKSFVAGEAGNEAVVPLKEMTHAGSNRQMDMRGFGSLAGSGGGGMSVTVNISGQFIEGDQSKWQSLIKNKIVPEIRRWTQSNPNGPFERKRGSLT